MKLYAAGLVSPFQWPKVLISHMGEVNPMMVDRIKGLKFFTRRLPYP
jgi:hypothetical protein